MIRVGIAGFGFMGRMHYRCWKAVPGASVTAVCDANPNAFASSGAAAGNIGGASDDVNLAGITTFSDFDKMLASGLIDAVSITLPTHMHRDFAIRALKAGQHVLCEKPMALNAADCDAMIAAADSGSRLLQIGHCIRFWPEYVAARKLALDGRYGRIVAAGFQRFSPMPAWNTTNWFTDESRSGGMPLDLHVHDVDFVQHLLGLPLAVTSTADPDLTHMFSTFIYNKGPAVTAEASWRTAKSHGFRMAFTITLEQATITYDSKTKPTMTVFPADGAPFTPDITGTDGYAGEIAHFAARLKGEPVDNTLTLEQSKNTVLLTLACKASARAGSMPVQINGGRQ